MRKQIFAAFLFLLAALTIVVNAQDDGLLIDDFENGVPLLTDQDGTAVGLVTWGSTFENVSLSARQIVPFSEMAVPGYEEKADTTLAIAYNIDSWGGFTHAFTDGTDWISMDWTAYNALQFWLYGNNTGGQIQIDLFDNRNPDVTGDSAERYFYRIGDNYTGWQQFAIPFELFERRTDFQPNGAPDDGLGLDAVSGYAFGFPANVGAQTAYLDDVKVVTVENTTSLTITGVETAAGPEIDDSITWDSRQWELTWSDEFDAAAGTPINDENWTCETGGEGWGNSEWEYYTTSTDNVSHDGNGSLTITARQENPEDYQCWYGTCTHTSARCITADKVEVQYGRVEARLHIPHGQGIWPAFWMLGSNFRETGWPNSGEIDIMENIGKEPKNIYGTVHGPGYSGANGIGSHITGDADYADDYHVYAIDWDPDAIRWYVDGEMFNIVTQADLGNRKWVFDHEFFILLNVAVGGAWPGYPDETTVFPQEMKVDYVRVYKLVE